MNNFSFICYSFFYYLANSPWLFFFVPPNLLFHFFNGVLFFFGASYCIKKNKISGQMFNAQIRPRTTSTNLTNGYKAKEKTISIFGPKYDQIYLRLHWKWKFYFKQKLSQNYVWLLFGHVIINNCCTQQCWKAVMLIVFCQIRNRYIWTHNFYVTIR
jgi:hypothetical protein